MCSSCAKMLVLHVQSKVMVKTGTRKLRLSYASAVLELVLSLPLHGIK